MDASNKKIEILLVEDNPGDIDLTREALERADVESNLTVVTDGEEALALLRKEGCYAKTPRPDIILLDLYLPRMNGCEVLAAIRSEEKLKCIPVVILSSSHAEHDITRSYRSKANCFITKPIDVDQFMEAIHSFEDFWMTVVKLPPHHDE